MILVQSAKTGVGHETACRRTMISAPFHDLGISCWDRPRYQASNIAWIGYIMLSNGLQNLFDILS